MLKYIRRWTSKVAGSARSLPLRLGRMLSLPDVPTAIEPAPKKKSSPKTLTLTKGSGKTASSRKASTARPASKRKPTRKTK